MEPSIKENTFAGNRVGILVFAGVDNVLKENVVTGSSLAGIRINTPATGNRLVENTVASNPVGVEFLVTAAGSATGNAFIENTIIGNGCGIKGPTAGSTFRENAVEQNGMPTCRFQRVLSSPGQPRITPTAGGVSSATTALMRKRSPPA